MRRSDKREFLMLAHKFTDVVNKTSVGGWYLSEKLDGFLALWDGGLTRGIPTTDVAWANIGKDKKAFVSTGLWTRYGKSIQAPDWFLDQLPPIILAGELYAGRGLFNVVSSVVRKHVPVHSEWEGITFMHFDAPHMDAVTAPGRIHLRDWRTTFGPEIFEFAHSRRKAMRLLDAPADFSDYVGRTIASPVCKPVQQEVLPMMSKNAVPRIYQFFEEVVALGGEGVVIRHPSSMWTPHRSYDYLKLKPDNDAEAVVIGYRTGKKTNDGSRNLGRMGSLIVQAGDPDGPVAVGKIFDINGFTDVERELWSREGGVRSAYEWAVDHPNTPCPDEITNLTFPRGTIVTYKYTELTADGIPRHANFLRERNDG